jgi:lipopolysaccharide transport system permease protein
MQDLCSPSIVGLTQSVWRNRGLIKALILREVMGRYRGSILGAAWSLLSPILMLTIYTLIFSSVLKAKWDVGADSKVEFALILFVGLIVFNFFSECVNQSPLLIISNSNYVTKVIFPLEILPIVCAGTALIHMLASLVICLIFYVLNYGFPHESLVLLPIVLLPLMLITLGASFLISSLGVYLRDLSQFIGLLVMGLMFLSPIFYPLSVLPEDYQNILIFNPITPGIEFIRKILIWGVYPKFEQLAIYFLFSLVCLSLGFFVFQKLRKGFGDAI